MAPPVGTRGHFLFESCMDLETAWTDFVHLNNEFHRRRARIDLA